MINFKRLKEEKQKIKESILKEDYVNALVEIKTYEDIHKYDMDIYNIKACIYFYYNEYEKALKMLMDIYYKYEYNWEINYNLSIIYYYEKEYSKSLKYLLSAKILDKDDEIDINDILDNILEHISKEEFEKIKNKVILYYSNIQYKFPITMENGNKKRRIKELKYRNCNYYCGIYDYYFNERDTINIDNDSELTGLMKYEILEYKKVNELSYKVDNKMVIPILINKENQEVNIHIDGEVNKFTNLLPERFYYYTFNPKENIKIKSTDEFIVGNEILMTKKNKFPALVLNIFIDGLSQKFIEENDFKTLMPNTYKFFKEGTICKNVYTSGEWTYTALASVFTGKYTNNHRVFHPNYDTNNIFKNELYSEVLKSNGYFNGKIDEDYRSSPTLGYMKGFDRYVFQQATRGMFVDEVITETIEHIEAFKEKNNFIWMCIPDLHDVADEAEGRISTQINSSVKCRIFKRNQESSVRQSKDLNKNERYMVQLRRIDTYLGLLFNYIRDNYREDDFLISIMSDHGQGFFIDSNMFLDEARSKVPMMFRGKNIPVGECQELISTLDLFPIILESIGIKEYNKFDTNVPKYFNGENSRGYTYTESMYPEARYYASINDYKYKFFFETKQYSTNDGRIRIEDENDFIVSLINKSTGKDETKESLEVVSYYIDIVFQHINDYIII